MNTMAKHDPVFTLKIIMEIRDLILNGQPQQIFKGAGVMGGVHYSNNLDFLINNYYYSLENTERIEKDEHSVIVDMINKKDNIIDIEETKKHLLFVYKTDRVRYLSNLCNLTYSEN